MLQWTEATDETIRSYCNGIRTSAGGTHESGFKGAIGKAIRDYIATHEIKIKGLDITADDIREGIVGVLSAFSSRTDVPRADEGAARTTRLSFAVEGIVRPALEAWLNTNTSAADQIVGRIVLAAKARLASREAASEVKRKSVTSRRLNLLENWRTAVPPISTSRSYSSSKAIRPAARPTGAGFPVSSSAAPAR